MTTPVSQKGSQPVTQQLSAEEVQRTIEWMAERLATLRAELGRVIVGQATVVDSVILGMLAHGHVLLEGVPGIGKTLLVRTLAQALHVEFSRVQFTPDLKASDVLGTQVLVEDERGGRQLVFQPGPVFTNVLLADEINRATPKTQSALLEAMQERSVTIGRTTHQLSAPFFVLATQNPLEMEGTYPLPEAQLDRFIFKVEVPLPTPEDLHEIVARTLSPQPHQVQPVMTGEDILKIHLFALGCPIARHVVDYAVQLVHGSNGHLKSVQKYLRSGASPRAAQALVLGAKLRALSQGRAAASIDDIKALAKPALRHRILLSFDAEADRVRPDHVIEQMLGEVDRLARA
ncbi:MAG: MoxR family ATPase [Myxococcales bacterium]|nr:MoxR family ATPase [Myxococcales bacterium]